MNKVILSGRLTADPELRYTGSGVAVTTYNLAVQRDYKNENGDYETDFFRCVAWRKKAEFVANYLKKGRRALVVGQLRTRTYEDDEGNRRTVTEIQVENVEVIDWDDNKKATEEKPRKAKSKNPFADADPFADDGAIEIDDKDLPF